LIGIKAGQGLIGMKGGIDRHESRRRYGCKVASLLKQLNETAQRKKQGRH
jgi:hypothetical protein